MATLKQLVNEIDDNDMQVQFMKHGNCDLAIRCKKAHQYLEAKFHSSPENMYKEAIIIWVDREKLQSAVNRLNVFNHEKSTSNSGEVNQQPARQDKQ